LVTSSYFDFESETVLDAGVGLPKGRRKAVLSFWFIQRRR